jgi:hypothetical protein
MKRLLIILRAVDVSNAILRLALAYKTKGCDSRLYGELQVCSRARGRFNIVFLCRIYRGIMIGPNLGTLQN